MKFIITKFLINKLLLVCCNSINNSYWKFNHSELENNQGYLKSNDTINLSIKKTYDNSQVEFLRSHDVQFTIGNDTFQEVVCHKERIGGNDEVSKLILFLQIYYLRYYLNY